MAKIFNFITFYIYEIIKLLGKPIYSRVIHDQNHKFWPTCYCYSSDEIIYGGCHEAAARGGIS